MRNGGRWVEDGCVRHVGLTPWFALVPVQTSTNPPLIPCASYPIPPLSPHSCHLQSLGLVERLKLADERLDVAVHDAWQVAEVQLQTMIGDAILREIVGADLL